MSISKFLFHAFLLFLVTGGVAGVLLSATLVLRPSWLLRSGQRINQWIATRHLSNMLERVVKVDRWLYRYHQVGGILLLTGAAFLIYFFTARIDKLRIVNGLSNVFSLPPAFAGVLLDSAVLSILLGAAFAMIISLFLLLRPSMLKGFEQNANQWISLRRALRPFEISHAGVDAFVFQNVQMAGVLLLFGSLYALAVLTIWL